MSLTKQRTIQYIGILISLFLIAVGYFYWQAKAGTRLNTSLTDTLSEGLVGYWPLDDGSGVTATDASGNGNNGTLTNGPTWGTGRIGGATTFDGTDDYVSVAGGGGLNNLQTGSISLWVKWTGTQDWGFLDWNYGAITGRQVDGVGQSQIIALNGSNPDTAKIIWSPYGGGGVAATSLVSPGSGSWRHVVVTYTSGDHKLYVDGILSGSGSSTGSVLNNPAPVLSIGAWIGGGNSYSTSSIDEVRVYNRVLSADEISKLYKTTSPSNPAANLVGYWSFDGDDISGTTAYDRSNKGNNGTTSGSPAKTDGIRGQALSFDGAATRVSLGTPSFTQTDAEGTATAWVKGTGYYLAKTDNGVPGGDWQYSLRFSIASSKVCLSSQPTTTELLSVCTTNTIDTTAWNFVATKVTTAGGTEIYVNGVKQPLTYTTGSQATHLWFSDAWKAGTNVLYVGVRNPNGSPAGYFSGSIDEVRIYNSALTAAQIYDLYKSGSEAVGVSNPTRSSLDSGLAGYWPLDDASGVTATDKSTNANNGTLTNGPTWGTGQITGATTFDGADDYITLGSPTALDNISQKTVTAWVKLTTFGENAVGSILNKYHTTSAGWSLYVDDNGGGLQRLRFDQHFTGLAGQWNTPTNVLTTGQWMFVTVSYDRTSITNDPVFYVNGSKVATGEGQAPLGSASDDSANDLYIGNRSGLDRTFNGSIDEVRVYNRILSADEIARLYKTTTPGNPDTRLKGYWSFDGSSVSGTTARDLSGSGNNGTLTNGPTITEGIRGQAMRFDGVDDNASIPDQNAIDFNYNQDFTVSVWTSVASLQTSLAGQWNPILEKWNNTAAPYSYVIRYINHNNASWGKVYVARYDGTHIPTMYSNNAINDGGWHHITFSKSGSLLSLYVDGILDGTTTDTTTTTTTNTLPVWVGALGGNQQYFKGSIDEVRVYNTALTASEIWNLYQEGGVKLNKSQSNNGDSLNDGLAGYWKLDDASGTTATDSSGNANSGTLTNGPTWGAGRIGGALDFDGSNDYVDAGATANFTSSDFSTSFWVYPRTLTNCCGSSDNPVVIGNGQYEIKGWTLQFMGGASPYINFQTHQNGAHQTVTSSTGYLKTNEWQLITVTRRGATGKIYYNGIEIGSSNSLIDPVTAGGNHLVFSQYNGNPGQYLLNGLMDEVRVYNRALSADEVTKLYKTTSPTNPETGLVGYWSFNGKDLAGTTTYDRSGKGNNGTLTLGPTITEGRIGQALSFDGSNDYVSMPALDFGSTFSVSLWIKPYVDGDSSARGIINRAQVVCQTNGFSVLTRVAGGSAGQIVVQTGDGSTCDVASTNTGMLSYGQWSHLVVTVDKTGGIAHIYLNGTDIATDTTILTTFSTSGTWNIGKLSTAFPGALDEVRVYNRILSATEITNLYNFGR